MKKELDVGSLDAPLYTGPKSQVVKTWIEMFTEGKLTAAYLREWFSGKISEFYFLEECGPMFRRFKSSDQLSTLTAVMEEFIFNGEKDPLNEFLKGTGQAPLLCGKGFKNGEPSFNCKECCTDHTCVMCTECFQNSQHRHHKYRMATSSGGGYCDCGDTEAWKNYPSCDTHKPSLEADTAPAFPSDIHERSKLIFSFMLQFSHDIINRFYSADLRVNKVCSDDNSEEQYVLLMYNDETHTFDQVINLLVQIIKCTPREGLELASKINKEGRAIVTTTDFETCYRLKLDIEKLSTTGNNRFLEVHILPFQVAANQSFALDSLAWMQILVKTNQGFRSALIEVLKDCYCPNEVSLLDQILVQDSVLWKSARTQWNELLCSGFLPDNESKKILAIHYLINYPKIMQNYLNDEEDHTFSTAGLSVQLFTVPSISQELISNYGALESVINFIINVSTNDRNANGKLVFKRMFSRSFERACYLLYDVRYLLCSPPTSTWPDQLRVGFCRGMCSLFDFLGFIEGMDACKRQLGSHIEFEPEWETAFNIQMKCYPVITHSLEWCASDEKALKEVYLAAVTKLKEAQSSQKNDDIMITFDGSSFRCKRFETSLNAVSIHLPLTRYWGSLYLMLISSTEYPVGALSIVELIEPVMRTRAMVAQFQAGMWRKNGHSLSTQMFFYHDTKFRNKTLDMDILVLQVGASLIDSDAFLVNLAYDFGIASIILSDQETTGELPQTEINQLWALVDELLYLVIVLVTERFKVGVGDVTLSDCIRHELLHVLAVKPMSYSELCKSIGPLTEHVSQLETVIKEQTTFKMASETPGKRQYELKDPYQPDFNVFFYHFTKEISFKSEQVQKEHYKKQKGLECCPPPSLPPFLKPFSKVINLLNCKTMLHTMKLVIEMWISETHVTDGHLHKVIFLFGLALLEEEKSDMAFCFTEKATDSKIVDKMLELYCSERFKDHKDLMKWVLKKFGKLRGDKSIEAAMSEYDEKQKSGAQQSDAKARAEAARAKIMANMKRMQQQFNKNLVEVEGEEVLIEASTSETEASITCILCQGNEALSIEGKTMVYSAFVQLSTVHLKNREQFTPEDLKEVFLTSKMGPCPFVSTCGHAMHAGCWEAWRMDVTRSRATRPSQRPFSHDPLKNEFLCPLCECISNIAMPILPPDILDNINTTTNCEVALTFRQWLDIILKLLHVSGLPEREKRGVSSSENTPHQERLSHQASSPGVSLGSFPGSPRQNEQSNQDQTLSEVGYNLNFGDRWVLHIKRLNDSLKPELVPVLMEIPIVKLEWINAMGSEIGKVGTTGPNQSDAQQCDCMMVWKTLAYTIHSLEASMRYSGKPIFSGLTPREKSCLENLIRISYVQSVNKKPHSLRLGVNMCAINLLDMIVKNGKDSRCVLEWDCFGVLVALLVAAPNIVSGGGTQVPSMASINNFLLKLMLLSRIAQILITLDLGKYRVRSIRVGSATECVPFLLSVLGHSNSFYDSDEIWEDVKDGVRPFLRCCSIFFHSKQPDKFANDSDLSRNDTFENLVSYLQLPTSCNELLNDDLTIDLFMTWAEHPKVRGFHIDGVFSWKFEPYIKEIGKNRINTLVKLPQDYSELLKKVRDFSCSSDSEIDDSQNPTMCLICGKILCSLSYCCQTELNQQKVGACTFHAHECGGGVGIFLQIRECQLIVFAGLGRGCYKIPPYLDEHYEPDQGLRRGNKLLLCEESYRQLELSWLNHSLYDMVTRAIEMGGFGMGRWLFF